MGALAHPFSGALALFLLATVVSAAVNAVPPQVAATGLIFTRDAAVLFYLPRMVGFTHEQIRLTMRAVAIVVVVTSLIGIGQAILLPHLLGVTPVTGRSGEGVRSVPSCAIRTSGDPDRAGPALHRVLAGSNGARTEAMAGRRRSPGPARRPAADLLPRVTGSAWRLASANSLIIDRRALVTFLAILLLFTGTAVVMPKGILSGLGQGDDPFARP